MKKTYTVGNKRVRIEQDDDTAMNPREWDNLGTIVAWHRRYNLGDEQPSESVEGWKERMVEWEEGDEETAEAKFNRLFVWLPVYMYDHSGITINTRGLACPWDSGQIGFIYVSREKLEREKMTEEHALEYLNGEIETYDQYLRGEVYCFVTEEYNAETDEWTETDSCGGFYGTDWKTNGMADYCPLLRDESGVWSERGV